VNKGLLFEKGSPSIFDEEKITSEQIKYIHKKIKTRANKKKKPKGGSVMPPPVTEEEHLTYIFSKKYLDDNLVNNSNIEQIKQKDFSHIIQKGIMFPKAKNASGRYLKDYENTHKDVFESLSYKQKGHYYECHEAFKIMVFGDSILVKDWKVMFLLLYHKQAKKISFEMQFITKTTYRVWKTGKNKEVNNQEIDGNKEQVIVEEENQEEINGNKEQVIIEEEVQEELNGNK
jgi:hypothetical protein